MMNFKHNDEENKDKVNPHWTDKQRKVLLEGDTYPVDKDKYTVGYGEEEYIEGGEV